MAMFVITRGYYSAGSHIPPFSWLKFLLAAASQRPGDPGAVRWKRVKDVSITIQGGGNMGHLMFVPVSGLPTKPPKNVQASPGSFAAGALTRFSLSASLRIPVLRFLNLSVHRAERLEVFWWQIQGFTT